MDKLNMKLDSCKKCKHLDYGEEYCNLKRLPLARIKACSRSQGGRKFLKPGTVRQSIRRKKTNWRED